MICTWSFYWVVGLPVGYVLCFHMAWGARILDWLLCGADLDREYAAFSVARKERAFTAREVPAIAVFWTFR